MPISGVDLSHHNTTMPSLDGLSFVIHKATQSNDFFDPMYAGRHTYVKAQGKVWGSYHFWTPRVSDVVQVLWYAEHADVQPGEIIALDFEDDGSWAAFAPSTLASGCRDALVRMRETFPNNRLLLYCNRNTLHNIVDPFGVAEFDGLWIADPNGAPPPPWRFWQYTSTTYDHDYAEFDTQFELEGWLTVPPPAPFPFPHHHQVSLLLES